MNDKRSRGSAEPLSRDGLTYVERGVHRVRPDLQGRRVCHLPFQFFGMSGDSFADLPSYMQAGN